ncbi:MAG: hypothetical protein ACRD06_07955, partial [Terriglobia bacterium]
MRKTLTLALIAGVMILTPLALRADSITETFTSGLSPSGTTLPATPIPSGLSLFNPAQGTLTGISVTISGTATWASTSSSPLLLAYIDSITGLNSTSQRFNTPGSINISVTGTSTSNPALALFTGTGDYNGTMLVLFVSQLET